MKEVITLLQAQVNQLKQIIMEMSTLVVIDEAKKDEIISKINQIEDIQIENKQQDIQIIQNKKKIPKEKNKKNKNEKRKEFSQTQMYPFIEGEITGKISTYNQQYKDEGIQRVVTK